MSEQPQSTPGDDLPEQMRVRRDKRQRLIDRGAQPYPVTVERTHTLAQIRATYDVQDLPPDTRTGEQVAVTGRVMFLRNTGKLCFVRLREGDGTELQVSVAIDNLVKGAGGQAIQAMNLALGIDEEAGLRGGGMYPC